MNYDLLPEDESNISSFGKNLINAINTDGNKIVYFVGDNATFNAGMASFSQGWSNAVFSLNGIPSLYEAMTTEKKAGYETVKDIFKAQSFDKSDWTTMYKGNGTVGVIDGLEALDY